MGRITGIVDRTKSQAAFAAWRFDPSSHPSGLAARHAAGKEDES
jgi:hypothetical protein